MCISETALMFKILLNIFYLCHAPNANEGHKSVRFMIDVIGFSDIKRPIIFSITCDVIRERRNSEELTITDGIECRRLTMIILFVYARTILFRLQVKTLKCLYVDIFSY